MKHIRILKETTNHWKGVPTGTVIAMMNDEDADSVIKNAEGELVAEGERFTSLQNIEDRMDTVEQRQQNLQRQFYEMADQLYELENNFRVSKKVSLHNNHRDEDRMDTVEQRQQKEAQRLLELNLQVQRLAQECGCKLQDMTKIRKLLDQ